MTVYTFKYLNPNEMVYVIRGNKRSLYSEPYTNRGNVRNSVIAYKDSMICHSKIKELSIKAIAIEKVQLIDLEGTCAELQMPLNVVLNEYCDITDKREYKEIFFFENKEDDEFSIKKLYMK